MLPLIRGIIQNAVKATSSCSFDGISPPPNPSPTETKLQVTNGVKHSQTWCFTPTPSVGLRIMYNDKSAARVHPYVSMPGGMNVKHIKTSTGTYFWIKDVEVCAFIYLCYKSGAHLGALLVSNGDLLVYYNTLLLSMRCLNVLNQLQACGNTPMTQINWSLD